MVSGMTTIGSAEVPVLYYLVLANFYLTIAYLTTIYPVELPSIFMKSLRSYISFTY